MTDKEWLDRVSLAYRIYSKNLGPTPSIERFIEWLYHQYGIIQQDKKY